jgi:hypothetical protein
MEVVAADPEAVAVEVSPSVEGVEYSRGQYTSHLVARVEKDKGTFCHTHKESPPQSCVSPHPPTSFTCFDQTNSGEIRRGQCTILGFAALIIALTVNGKQDDRVPQ